jgi:hypothetical protein
VTAVAWKKGDLVRIVLWSVARGDSQYPQGVRSLTQAERDRMEHDPWWRELDSAGEPRIMPRHKCEHLEPGQLLTVIRARASAPRDLCWGKWAHGHVLVLDPSSGHEYYIKRHYLEAASASEGETENA